MNGKFGRTITIAVPLIILSLGMYILQFHAIAFWTGRFGVLTGWAVSLTLEGGALWLWWKPRAGWRFLGGIATLVLLAGPLYVTGQPLLEEMAEGDSRGKRLLALEARIATLGAEKTGLLEVIVGQQRRGWQGLLEDVNGKLDSAADERSRLLLPAARMDWEARGLIAMNLAALALAQAFNVLAILFLSTAFRTGTVPVRNTGTADSEPAVQPRYSAASPPVPPVPVQPAVSLPHPAPEPARAPPAAPVHPGAPGLGDRPGRSLSADFCKPDLFTLRRLQDAVSKQVESLGGVNKFCARHQVNKPDYSKLMQHEERVKNGGDLISLRKFNEWREKFLPENVKEA